MQEPMLAGLAAVMLGACLSGQSQVPFCDEYTIFGVCCCVDDSFIKQAIDL